MKNYRRYFAGGLDLFINNIKKLNMKKSKFKMKTLVFYLILAAFLIMSQTMEAQSGKSDVFFTNNNGGYDDRDANSYALTGNVTNDSFGSSAPIGSGLLIMVAAGLFYAIKTKRYEKD